MLFERKRQFFFSPFGTALRARPYQVCERDSKGEEEGEEREEKEKKRRGEEKRKKGRREILKGPVEARERREWSGEGMERGKRR